ncbi:MAG: hypothetical protein JWM10_4602 [Myxococcaceae bacterium]|nr:hypothetical protein [Myxococcaceae bacterium]
MGPRAVLLGLGLAVSALAPGGCVRSRREVMLVLSTDASCTIFDRVQIRVSRGAETIPTFDQTFLRSDCNAVGISPPPAVPLSEMTEFRLGIVDSRRSDDRVRVDVTARTAEGLVFTTSASTTFVDGSVYAMPVRLALSCASNALACPADFTCRPRQGSDEAACGSVFREPGTFGTFPAAQPAHITVDDE